MKRNSDLRNTWSSCVMQMLKRQTRVTGAVRHGTINARIQNTIYDKNMVVSRGTDCPSIMLEKKNSTANE